MKLMAFIGLSRRLKTFRRHLKIATYVSTWEYGKISAFLMRDVKYSLKSYPLRMIFQKSTNDSRHKHTFLLSSQNVYFFQYNFLKFYENLELVKSTPINPKLNLPFITSMIHIDIWVRQILNSISIALNYA